MNQNHPDFSKTTVCLSFSLFYLFISFYILPILFFSLRIWGTPWVRVLRAAIVGRINFVLSSYFSFSSEKLQARREEGREWTTFKKQSSVRAIRRFIYLLLCLLFLLLIYYLASSKQLNEQSLSVYQFVSERGLPVAGMQSVFFHEYQNNTKSSIIG